MEFFVGTVKIRMTMSMWWTLGNLRKRVLWVTRSNISLPFNAVMRVESQIGIRTRIPASLHRWVRHMGHAFERNRLIFATRKRNERRQWPRDSDKTIRPTGGRGDNSDFGSGEFSNRQGRSAYNNNTTDNDISGRDTTTRRVSIINDDDDGGGSGSNAFFTNARAYRHRRPIVSHRPGRYRYVGSRACPRSRDHKAISRKRTLRFISSPFAVNTVHAFVSVETEKRIIGIEFAERTRERKLFCECLLPPHTSNRGDELLLTRKKAAGQRVRVLAADRGSEGGRAQQQLQGPVQRSGHGRVRRTTAAAAAGGLTTGLGVVRRHASAVAATRCCCSFCDNCSASATATAAVHDGRHQTHVFTRYTTLLCRVASASEWLNAVLSEMRCPMVDVWRYDDGVLTRALTGFEHEPPGPDESRTSVVDEPRETFATGSGARPARVRSPPPPRLPLHRRRCTRIYTRTAKRIPLPRRLRNFLDDLSPRDVPLTEKRVDRCARAIRKMSFDERRSEILHAWATIV